MTKKTRYVHTILAGKSPKEATRYAGYTKTAPSDAINLARRCQVLGTPEANALELLDETIARLEAELAEHRFDRQALRLLMSL